MLNCDDIYGMNTIAAYSVNVIAVPGFDILDNGCPSRTMLETSGAFDVDGTRSSRQAVRSLLLPM